MLLWQLASYIRCNVDARDVLWLSRGSTLTAADGSAILVNHLIEHEQINRAAYTRLFCINCLRRWSTILSDFCSPAKELCVVCNQGMHSQHWPVRGYTETLGCECHRGECRHITPFLMQPKNKTIPMYMANVSFCASVRGERVHSCVIVTCVGIMFICISSIRMHMHPTRQSTINTCNIHAWVHDSDREIVTRFLWFCIVGCWFAPLHWFSAFPCEIVEPSAWLNWCMAYRPVFKNRVPVFIKTYDYIWNTRCVCCIWIFTGKQGIPTGVECAFLDPTTCVLTLCSGFHSCLFDDRIQRVTNMTRLPTQWAWGMSPRVLNVRIWSRTHRGLVCGGARAWSCSCFVS